MSNIPDNYSQWAAHDAEQEAAKKINVSNKTLCNWESGASMPKVDKIDAICDLYGIAYDNIIFLPSNSL